MPHLRDILLLGATGTIGRATLTALLDQGHRVTCLTRRPADLPARPKGGVGQGARAVLGALPAVLGL